MPSVISFGSLNSMAGGFQQTCSIFSDVPMSSFSLEKSLAKTWLTFWGTKSAFCLSCSLCSVRLISALR